MNETGNIKHLISSGIYFSLFAGLGLFSYFLLINFTTIGDISIEVSPVIFVLFFILAFNILGFSILRLSTLINTRYPRYMDNKWKIAALYLLTALMLLVINYGIIVSAKLLSGANRPFIFPNG